MGLGALLARTGASAGPSGGTAGGGNRGNGGLLPPGLAMARAASRGTLVLASLGVAGVLVLLGQRFLRRTSKRRLLSELRRSLLRQNGEMRKNVCIGAIFGMDVGGTLSKVVYFEKLDGPPQGSEGKGSRRRSSLALKRSPPLSPAGAPTRASPAASPGQRGEAAAEGVPSLSLPPVAEEVRRNASAASLSSEKEASPMVPPMRRSRSFDILVRPDHVEVLREFYRIMDETRHLGTTGVREEDLRFYSKELGGNLHFVRFETRRFEGAMDFVAANCLHMNITHIPCTGGGAYKYSSLVKETLGIELDKMDEMESLVRGLQFVLDNSPDEVYTYRPTEAELKATMEETMGRKDREWTRRVTLKGVRARPLPYMVVSIGTGVSIIKVTGRGDFERVSGSSIGGGTYWGLCKLFVGGKSFKEVLDLAEGGDPSRLDMLVGDIYGGDYRNLGLPANAVASSFGKLVSKESAKDGIREQDFARALLLMITNNIGQVAYLNAMQHDVKTIYFVGSFLRANSISATRLAYAINFWSKGTMEANFLLHEGFLGAIGAFLGHSVPGL